MKKTIFKAALALVATCLSSNALMAQTNIFPSNGKVGIATTSPSAYLDIATWSDWGSPALRLSKPGGSDIRIINDANGFSLRNFTFITGESVIFNVRSSRDEILFAVKESGNIGIGTATPEYKLDIVGQARFKAAGNGSVGFFLTDKANTENRAFFGMISDNMCGMVGKNNSSRTLNMDVTNGNVGIGTTSPAQKLDVAGTVKATGFQLPVANYDANTQYIVKADANGNFTWTPFRDIQSIYASTWGSNVSTNGYKLVGATGSNAGLKVKANGMVSAPGFACDSVVTADFVFEPDYELQPLHKVEEYIQTNRHLPGVPSADEYQKRGQVDISELQTLLLQKVEELTLYAIEQNKNNEALKQRIAELEKGLGKK